VRATSGSGLVAAWRAEVFRLRSPPFPHIRTGVSSRTPGAVKGARFLRVHRSEAKTLYGEDGPHTLVCEGKGARVRVQEKAPALAARAGAPGLVFLRQQDARRRAIGFGDDLDFRPIPQRVRGENPESFLDREFILGGVRGADLTPIARDVAAKEFYRGLPGGGEGSQRTGCADELSQREARGVGLIFGVR
jgi:hypothetical protein